LRCRQLGRGPVAVAIGGGTTDACWAILAERYCLVVLDPVVDSSATPPEAVALAIDEGLKQLGLERFSMIAQYRQPGAALLTALCRAISIDAVVLLSPEACEAGEDVLDELRALDLPVLVLAGTESGTASAAARRCRETLKNCHVTFVYGAADQPADERPEAVAALVADFLERRERFIVNAGNGEIYP
jgi:pimeloyl-ACP methyl ester carboxylesterase